jgi:hypothetical protein
MKKLWQYLIPFIDSLLIHVVLLGILVIGVNLPKSSSDVPVVQEMRVINEKAVLAEMQRLKREKDFNKTTQDAQAYALKQKQEAYKKLMASKKSYLEKLQKKQRAEEQELKRLKQRRLREEKKLNKLSRDKAKLE